MSITWTKRHEWAICYRHQILTRGNNTNNIAEAGIRIVKELIFGRIKAYNLIQMFQFVTDALETYMTRKLLSIAHNRFDHFISTRFKGLLAEKINKSSITVLNPLKKLYKVHSSKDPTIYAVDMDIGTCSCEKGRNGSPCSHQAAIVFHYQIKSINFVPTLYPSLRQGIAFLALGGKARQDINFYSSLHDIDVDMDEEQSNTSTSDFTGRSWDVVRAGALDDNDRDDDDDDGDTEIMGQARKKDLLEKIDRMAETMKSQLDSNDPQLVPGIEKFLARFHELSALQTTGRLASALHSFGTETRRGVSRASGNRRWGKRIGVQATASGRRKYSSKGKAQVIAGRPRTSFVNKVKRKDNKLRYTIPLRKKNQMEKKRPHNLSLNISLGRQNAGKW